MTRLEPNQVYVPAPVRDTAPQQKGDISPMNMGPQNISPMDLGNDGIGQNDISLGDSFKQRKEFQALDMRNPAAGSSIMSLQMKDK